MCIVFLAYRKHPQYKLILAGNRDEFYERSTEKACFWEGYPNLLAGRDLEKKGTWLGITKDGKFAAITNYRDFNLLVENPISRGNIIKNYLINNIDPSKYLEGIKKHRKSYNPFNVLMGNKEELFYYSNIQNKIERLEPGIYGLSNGFLDTPWPKVLKGRKEFSEVIDKNGKIKFEDIFDILSNKETPPEDQLPQTGVGEEWERILSPIFIKSDIYGTKSSTVLMIDYERNVTFIEKSLQHKTKTWEETKYQFTIS